MIYLDNAGTTKLSEHAKESMLPYFDEVYGNASSLHIAGQIAKEALENARARVAKSIGAETNEIYFTSGGSESDNLAIKSVAKWGKLKGKTHIITSKIEHHAVLNTLKELEKQGFSVDYLNVDENGLVDVADLESKIKPETCLVTIMFANNEIGTIEPIQEIGEVCEKHGVYFHTDAVQAVGHVPVNVKEMHIGLLSLSGHKFHGPKGVGALYAKKGTPLFSEIYGGSQERGKRAGTENIPGIVGMSVALEDAVNEMKDVEKQEKELRDRLFKELSKISHSKINGDRNKRLPNNFNMSFEGIEGESLILLLSDEGICSTSGSACTSGSLDPSHVLLAIGLPHEIAHGSLRLTLSRYTTKEEIEKTIEVVPQIVEKLRKMSPVWDELEKGGRKHVI
jgi:cysteine desulfurase